MHPEIPWNTGNAGRSCLAAGARLHLVEPLGFSVDEKAVRRAGVDYWARVDPVVHASWDAFEERLPALGEPLFFSADAERTLWDAPIAENAVFVFGRESDGLPAELRARWRDRLVRLPVESPHVRSINVSTCVGIALYEALRRRR